MTKVLLVDDQPLLMTGFQMIIDAQPDMQVVGTSGNGFEAIADAARLQPDVVLMDVRMPKLNGIAATERIVNDPRSSNSRVLVLTTFDLDEYAVAAIQAGASGFLLKDSTPDALLSAIRDVAAGDAVVAPSTTRRLLDKWVTDQPQPLPKPPAKLDTLTEREREVMMELTQGKSNADIAESLFLAEGTVKLHVSRVLAKLGLRDRVQVVVFAYEHGIVTPGQHQPTGD